MGYLVRAYYNISPTRYYKDDLLGCRLEVKYHRRHHQHRKLHRSSFKTINGEVQLHAIVDGKKIVIIESIVRRDLQLEDAEGVDCLPNATIFEQLALMGYEQVLQKLTFYKAFFSQQWKFPIHTILQCQSSKTTAWNEFSSAMASAIICLATNQKFNFSKYIFESMVKNLENVSDKFLMYPRFVQVFVNQQLEGMPTHKRIYIAPSHTKKIFGNMRRVGKGFSRRETPLFQIMVVQDQADLGEAGSQGTTSCGGPRCQETIGDTIDQTRFENISKLSNDPLLARGNTLRSGEDSLKLKELMELCINLQTRVIDLETPKTTQANEIDSLKRRVKRLEKKKRSRTHGLKRLYKVCLSARVESFRDKEVLGEDASKQERRINAIDADEDITLCKPKVKANVIEEPSSVPVSAANVSTKVSAATTTTAIIPTPRKGIIITKLGTPTTTRTISSQQPSQAKVQDKRKGIMAKIEADHELAQRLQAEEQEGLSVEEKNMEGKKPKDLKNKSFDSNQKVFDRAFKRVNTFVDFRTDLVEDKRYPLTPATITDMLNKKLQCDHLSEMAYQLLKLLTKQLKKSGRIVGIKSLIDAVWITAALIDVNAAQSKLVLLENFNENYSKCLILLVKLQLLELVKMIPEELLCRDQIHEYLVDDE
ncbi:hypothetical protein Tco_0060392 [Tanacetum coccineum]